MVVTSRLEVIRLATIPGEAIHPEAIRREAILLVATTLLVVATRPAARILRTVPAPVVLVVPEARRALPVLVLIREYRRLMN